MWPDSRLCIVRTWKMAPGYRSQSNGSSALSNMPAADTPASSAGEGTWLGKAALQAGIHLLDRAAGGLVADLGSPPR
jgi:hypothetical protein